MTRALLGGAGAWQVGHLREFCVDTGALERRNADERAVTGLPETDGKAAGEAERPAAGREAETGPAPAQPADAAPPAGEVTTVPIKVEAVLSLHLTAAITRN
jgi:hypothetical protein